MADDPMADMLRQLKQEARYKKDAARASDALNKELSKQVAQTKDATHASDSLHKEIGEQTTRSKAALPNFGALGKVISSIASVSKIATVGLGAIGAVVSGITGALTAPLDAIQAIADVIMNLVQLANPGVMVEFMLAMTDAMAVLGHGMTPIMQGLTIAARAWGDSMAKLMPVMEPLFNELGQAIADQAGAWGLMIEVFAPLIQMFVDVAVPAIRAMSTGFAFLNGVMLEVIKTILDLVGLDTSRYNKGASSQGAAIRQFKTSGVEQFSKDLFQKQLAMLSKGDNGKKPEEHLADISGALEKGRALVASIAGNVQFIWDYFKAIRDGVKQEVNEGLDWAERNTGPGQAGGILARMMIS